VCCCDEKGEYVSLQGTRLVTRNDIDTSLTTLGNAQVGLLEAHHTDQLNFQPTPIQTDSYGSNGNRNGRWLRAPWAAPDRCSVYRKSIATHNALFKYLSTMWVVVSALQYFPPVPSTTQRHVWPILG